MSLIWSLQLSTNAAFYIQLKFSKLLVFQQIRYEVKLPCIEKYKAAEYKTLIARKYINLKY